MGKSEDEYKIDAQGSLGLLALGDIGLQLWRKEVKKKAESKKKTPNKNGKKTGK